MKKTLISKEQFKIMPWKNGMGTTAEIAIDPPGAEFSQFNFNWRLSSARIDDENRFSQFPGYDRILTVLSGHGLLLNNQELGPFEVFEFEGEEEIDCTLINGPVEDLGVIFKRNQYLCSFRILDVSAPMHLKLGEGTHFFLSLSHSAYLGDLELTPPHFLKIEEAPSVEIRARDYPVHLLNIAIMKKATVSKAKY